MSTPHDRRRFFRQFAGGAALAALGSGLGAFPSSVGAAAVPVQPRPTGVQQFVRIRGVVRSGGRPLRDLSVTDGYSVVRTAGDGTFELTSSSLASFVSLCLPAGYRIPRNPTGTARFYVPLDFSRPEMTAEFDLEPLAASDENHMFFLLADPQTQDLEETGMLRSQTAPDLRVVAERSGMECFGVGCGDIMYDRLELFPEWEQAVQEMGIPFFQVVGNHDLDQDVWGDHLSTQTFRSRFGPEYYSFDRGAVHYVVLDDVFWHSQGYIGYLTENQLAWLAADLHYVERGRTVVVLLHIPLLSSRYRRTGYSSPHPSTSVANRDALYELLSPYRAHVLSGHTHESEHVFEGGVEEHIHGTVCGAWWTGPICYDGTPNGYAVYEVKGEELRWTYKATGFGFEHQMRLYRWGADPQAPDEIVANVWNWDPRWQVVWYEDGVLKGPMARRRGLDPLSVKLHKGERLPVRRTWVEPQPVDHLFYAPASRQARQIRVEVTDRFGRVYSEVLEG